MELNTGKIMEVNFHKRVADAIGRYPHLLKDFNDVLKRCEDIGSGNGGFLSDHHAEFNKSVHGKRCFIETSEPSKAKRKKLIQELEVDKTPSYSRLMSRDDQKAIASQRSQVLNDQWVCVPPSPAKGNYSRKPRIINPSEEALNQYEDERYKFDMSLSYFRPSVKNVEKLLHGIYRKEITLENCFKFVDHLSVSNLRCIEQIYDNGKVGVLKILRKDHLVEPAEGKNEKA